jgi:1-acyl-sn-glycerol-3-phosphate acyltransferase
VVLPIRRNRSWKRRAAEVARQAPTRGRELARQAPTRGRELRAAAAQLDIPWARSWLAGIVRENFMRFVLNPIMDFYARRRATGRERLAALRGPVILVANHASHMDTPVILSALPRHLRKRTVVAAAADYFYRNRLVASVVSLIFNTTPIDRRGGGLSKKHDSHLDTLLDQGWNLLLYPEGTRSRGGSPGRVRRGAAVLAAAHDLKIVPIRVTGTGEAMPPGRLWPRRQRASSVSRRHRITVSFGEPITPMEDTGQLIESLQQFFENGKGSIPYQSPYSRRAGRRGPIG